MNTTMARNRNLEKGGMGWEVERAVDGTASRLLLIAVEQTKTLNAAADQWEEALCLHKFHWLLFVCRRAVK